MKACPWLFAALIVLAVQVSPSVVTVSAQSGTIRPHVVQGPGAASPLVGNTVTVRGVITAHTSSGFFIQTESGSEDADPNTSEGLFVAESTSVGAGIVHVTGTVQEFDDSGYGTVTRLVGPIRVVEQSSASLPNPIELTDAELSPTGSLDQLERFEGMRVRAASLTAISGTGLDGAFYAVLDDAARPFREPGIDAGSPLQCASPPCQFDYFDGNPERLRVDSDQLAGAIGVNLAVGSVVTDVVGPLHFEMGAYTLLPESTLEPDEDNAMTMRAARVTAVDEYSIASLNLGAAPFDYETQLAKASLMVRDMLNAPDIIAVQYGDAAVLADLALRIDTDAVAAGQPAPGYSAYLHGFLAKSSRVTVAEGDAQAVYEFPTDGSAPLFERSPVMLRAVVSGGAELNAQDVTVLSSELLSNADVHRADETGANARAQRDAQAEWLANFVQNRQLNDLGEALVLVGGFNAHAFNDGYVDVAGAVSGTPAPGSEVVVASPDLVTRDLVNLTGGLAADEQYSSVGRGNAQSLDHTLVSANLAAQVRGLEIARVNADFPEWLMWFADGPGGLSDRDPSVAYFSFPTDVTAPVFDEAPQDLVVEATGASGATVNFTVTATDDVDGPVAVTCVPSSGSVFALGNTGVHCSTQDAAGNPASADFTVTVEDTTAPVFGLQPADIEVTATNTNGAVVTFRTPAATDTVDANVVVTCAPTSGSLFQMGLTAVACTAVDDAGHAAVTGFTVKVTAPTSLPGHISGAGEVVAQKKISFLFDVKETSKNIDRGWVVVHVEDLRGRNDRYLVGIVTAAAFTNSANYSPGARPANGVDTVMFSGVGCWNGRGGHTFEITATDRGEPGRGRDTFAVVVKNSSGQIVESATGTLHRGNIQSRRR